MKKNYLVLLTLFIVLSLFVTSCRTNRKVVTTSKTASSTAEARAFVGQISPFVQQRCQKAVIPASVVVAMAFLESGFGKSELAVNANNLFGMKDNSKDHKDAYLYQKQYAGETGNWYKRFISQQACLVFFIDELLQHKTGLWKRDYSPVVRAYREDLNNGLSKDAAARNFMGNLVDKGYTTLSKDAYIERLERIITTYGLAELDN